MAPLVANLKAEETLKFVKLRRSAAEVPKVAKKQL